MITSDFPTRRQLTVKAFIVITLQNLSECYCYYKKDETAEYFLKIVEQFKFNDDSSIEDLVSIVRQFISENDKERGADAITASPLSPIILASVFCSRAGQALFDGENELAWTYIADAQHWTGVSMASIGIDKARDKTVAETYAMAFRESLIKNAKSGAGARDQKYEPIRQFAFEQVREKMPLLGWKSRSHAVKVIHKPVGEFTLRQGAGLKEPTMKTIDTWLATMPEAPTLFARK